MHPSDKDKLKPLEAPPLKHRGFDKALQETILRRVSELEEQQPRRSRTWLRAPLLGGVAAAALVLLLVLTNGLPDAGSGQPGSPLAEQPKLGNAARVTPDGSVPDQQPVFKSALLIGLRSDHTGDSDHYPYSEYRTVLVAPDNGELKEISSSEGILMPYKMGFWEIDTEKKSHGGKEVQILSAAPAGKQSSESKRLEQSPGDVKSKLTSNIAQLDTLTMERLSFAGNRYVAVEQQVESRSGGAGARSYVWIKNIEQLAVNRTLAFTAASELNIPLTDFFSADRIIGLSPRQWTLVRKPGRWTAQALVEGTNEMQLRELSAAPPEKVASFDRLSAPWEEIWERVPKATDAYSSPAGETVAVVTNDTVAFYLNGSALADKPALTLKLKDAESIIMMQWATGSYVERWKNEAGELLSASP